MPTQESTAAIDPSAAPPAGPADRLEYVDGLRAVAALLVLLNHIQILVYSRAPGYTPSSGLGHYTHWFLYGHFGVAMFIVVSAFCLMLPVVRQEGALRGGFRGFVARRAHRLLPPYYLSIAVCLAIGAMFDTFNGTPWDGMEHWDPRHVTLRVLGLHIVMLHSWFSDAWPMINSVYWSLAVEWWIYFLFPLLLLGWKYLRPIPTVLLASALGVAAYVPIHVEHERVCPHFVGLFALGMLGATAAFSPVWQRWRERIPWGVVTVCVVGGLALAASRIPIAQLDEAVTDFCVGLAMTVVLIAGSRPGVVRRVLSVRPLVAIGVFSYSLYLMHLPWLQILWGRFVWPYWDVLGGRDAALVALLVVGVPVVLAWSYLFFLACERPFLNRKPARAGSNDGELRRSNKTARETVG